MKINIDEIYDFILERKPKFTERIRMRLLAKRIFLERIYGKDHWYKVVFETTWICRTFTSEKEKYSCHECIGSTFSKKFEELVKKRKEKENGK